MHQLLVRKAMDAESPDECKHVVMGLEADLDWAHADQLKRPKARRHDARRSSGKSAYVRPYVKRQKNDGLRVAKILDSPCPLWVISGH
jgi:hypothetical protein